MVKAVAEGGKRNK